MNGFNHIEAELGGLSPSEWYTENPDSVNARTCAVGRCHFVVLVCRTTDACGPGILSNPTVSNAFCGSLMTIFSYYFPQMRLLDLPQTEEAAVAFLRERGLLLRYKLCDSCGDHSAEKWMTRSSAASVIAASGSLSKSTLTSTTCILGS